MTSDRARKRKIRTRMAVTGEPFMVAARALDGDGVSFLRREWGNGSGWPRLLPVQSLTLEMIITTATVRGQDGTLQELISRRVAGIRDFPQGADTVLTWDYNASDEQTQALRQQAKAAFQTAVAETGRLIPTTVAELASLLAELGVYQHTRLPNGVHRWRAEENLPLMSDVLPLPSAWIAREDDVRWRIVTAHAAFQLSDHLRQNGRPARLDTTIERLSVDCAVSPERIRNALDGMVYRNWLVVQRYDSSVDRGKLHQLPEHARITLMVDWTLLDHHDDKIGDETNDQEIDLSKLRWSSSPWAVYRRISQNPQQIDDNTLVVLANLPFRVKKFHGDTSLPCLHEIAIGHCMSVNATVDALHQLEQAGIIWWDADHQQIEIAGPDGSVGNGISEVIQRGLRADVTGI